MMADVIDFRPAHVLPFDFVHPEMWAGVPTPEREWLIEGWLPRGYGALLTGDGGTGKSLLAQQLATCIAFERPFLGIMPATGLKALYVTAEDDFSELQRRQVSICEALGVSLSDSPNRLALVSLRGAIGNELIGPDLMETEAFSKLRKTIQWVAGGGFVALDNIAHLFGANENDRHHVATFYSLIEKLAIETDTTILLLGHPPKNGAQFSGSTAWENQARTRLYLSRPSEGEDGSLDPNARVLTRAKANYAQTGEAVSFNWQDWAFVLPDEARPNHDEINRQNGVAAFENEMFLRLLDIRNQQCRAVSHSTRAGNYAPRAMADMPEARGISSEQLKRAMERLFTLGVIEANRNLWRDGKREWTKGIARAGRLPDGAGRSAPEAVQPIENICRTVVPDGLPDGCRTVHEVASQVIDSICRTVAGRLPDGSTRSGGGEPPLKGGPLPHPLDPREAGEDDISWDDEAGPDWDND